MKTLVTGDWHLGKVIDHYSMIDEQTYVLQQVKDYIIQHNIELLIITGDIYDRAIPAKEAIKLFDTFVSSCINDLQIKVIAITGNHDSYSRVTFGNQILQSSGFYIGEKFNETVDKITLEDSHGTINFYLIPFMPYQEVRNILNNNDIKSFHSAYSEMIQTIDFNEEERNILITHTFVVSNVMKTETSDSEKTLSLGSIDMVDAKLFNPFDYVCLGHIHKAQRIEKEHYRYTGSLMKYSFSEVNHNKSVILLDIKEKHHITTNLLPLQSKNDFVVIHDYFDNIIANETLIQKHKQDYLKIILKDEIEIPDVVAKLRVYFDNILEFKYEIARDISIKDSLISKELVDKLKDISQTSDNDFIIELFHEFAKKTADYDISDSQSAVVKKAVRNLYHKEQDQ